jgi:hypothetical protein
LQPYAINAFTERDFGMFVVADITMKSAGALFPPHHVTGFPGSRNERWRRGSATSVSLTGLTRLAAWQSRSSRHLDSFRLKRVVSTAALKDTQTPDSLKVFGQKNNAPNRGAFSAPTRQPFALPSTGARR